MLVNVIKRPEGIAGNLFLFRRPVRRGAMAAGSSGETGEVSGGGANLLNSMKRDGVPKQQMSSNSATCCPANGRLIRRWAACWAVPDVTTLVTMIDMIILPFSPLLPSHAYQHSAVSIVVLRLAFFVAEPPPALLCPVGELLLPTLQDVVILPFRLPQTLLPLTCYHLHLRFTDAI